MIVILFCGLTKPIYQNKYDMTVRIELDTGWLVAYFQRNLPHKLVKTDEDC